MYLVKERWATDSKPRYVLYVQQPTVKNDRIALSCGVGPRCLLIKQVEVQHRALDIPQLIKLYGDENDDT